MWEAEPDWRCTTDNSHSLCVLRHLPELRRVQQVSSGLAQAVVVKHIACCVDDRVLQDSSPPEPPGRILGCFGIQPRQEDHRTDRTEDCLRSISTVLLV